MFKYTFFQCVCFIESLRGFSKNLVKNRTIFENVTRQDNRFGC